jgi:hypothetical protein
MSVETDNRPFLSSSCGGQINRLHPAIQVVNNFAAADSHLMIKTLGARSRIYLHVSRRWQYPLLLLQIDDRDQSA